MTREDFFESITNIYDLIDFCHENECEQYVADLYDRDGVNDYIESCVPEWYRHNSWTELRDILNDMPDDLGPDDYYRIDDYGSFVYFSDSDFSNLSEEVADWCEDHDIFDDEDEEYEEEETSPFYVEEDCSDTDDEEAFPDDISFDDIVSAGVDDLGLAVVRAQANNNAKEASFIEIMC